MCGSLLYGSLRSLAIEDGPNKAKHFGTLATFGTKFGMVTSGPMSMF